MTARQPPSDDERRKASEHVAYEIERPCGTVQDIQQIHLDHHAGRNPSQWTRDALVESWTIHLRNTMHFLRGTEARTSDILAEDYFDGSQWYDLLTAIPGRSAVVAGVDEAQLDWRINKEIVHLTYNRIGITPEQKLWPIGEISRHLGRDLLVFVEHVAATRVAADFADRAHAALRTLG